MAKIGELALAGGRWNDRQLASKAWIETSTTPKLKAAGSQFTTHRALYAAKESDPDRLMMSGELIPWPGQGARKLLFNYRAKSVDGKVSLPEAKNSTRTRTSQVSEQRLQHHPYWNQPIHCEQASLEHDKSARSPSHPKKIMEDIASKRPQRQQPP